MPVAYEFYSKPQRCHCLALDSSAILAPYSRRPWHVLQGHPVLLGTMCTGDTVRLIPYGKPYQR